MKFLKYTLVLFLLLVLAAPFIGWWWLQGSLPLLNGTQQVSGLRAPVTLLRDGQGLLRVDAQDRESIAFGLGYAHAQDRFFQMDLQRRSASGELAALFGPQALSLDRAARLHRFRARALRNLALSNPALVLLLQAYANGVNGGLEDLDRPPFEYTVLRVDPEPWRVEDAFLTHFSMIMYLQGDFGARERGRGLIRAKLPADVADFFLPAGGAWDAPVEGGPVAPVPIPSTPLAELMPREAPVAAAGGFETAPVPGSNNWAVAGELTDSGSALVANDMHLGFALPNTWYRAEWRDPNHGRVVSGATLPGTPFMVVGSNERIAWGLTNTEGDWSDVILLETDESGGRYRTAEGWREFELQEEVLYAKGGDPEVLTVRETIWGPVSDRDFDGTPTVLRWVAHDPEGANFNIAQLEQANNAIQPLAAANRFGVPHVNLLIGDAEGNIGWTVAGAIPKREGLDGTTPGFWHEGAKGWSRYLDEEEHPRILNPSSGRLWTANARVLSGASQGKIGDGGFALGARQQQIRDRLQALETATVEDMRAIQLDDEARFWNRWHERLLARLEQPDAQGDAALAAAASAVRAWSGHADAGDVGFRLVRAWRLAVLERTLAPINQIMGEHQQYFSLSRVSRQVEYPAWTLLEQQPESWLNPAFASWPALELDAIRAVVTPLFDDGTLDNDPWGERNRLTMEHPLAGALPLIGRWLKLPDVALSGASHMPRVQRSRYGASQRFAVAPGHEEDGFFHMPGGQSGHPLSPFFTAGHEDWVEGRASAWYAGEPVHQLLLVPAADQGR